jgi:hypothetical protein
VKIETSRSKNMLSGINQTNSAMSFSQKRTSLPLDLCDYKSKRAVMYPDNASTNVVKEGITNIGEAVIHFVREAGKNIGDIWAVAKTIRITKP